MTLSPQLNAQKEKPKEKDLPNFIIFKAKNTISSKVRDKNKKFETDKDILEFHYVEMSSDMKTKSNNGWLKFNFPNGKNKMLKTHDVRYDKGKMKYWAGKDSIGIESAFMSFTEGGIRGYILQDDVSYEIYPLGDNLHAMLKRKPSKGQDCLPESHEDKNPKKIEPKPQKTPQPKNNEPNQAEIQRIEPCNQLPEDLRILVYFTPNAAAAIPGGNVQAVAKNSINQINQALANSGFPNRTVSLISVLPFGPFANAVGNNIGQNVRTDLNNLRSNAGVLAQRDALNADIVVFLNDGNYTDAFNREIRGSVVEDPGNYPSEPIAFALSDPIRADEANIFTFAHEFGHLFGARHQLSTTHNVGFDNGGTFAHAFSWTSTVCINSFICFNFPFASILHATGRVNPNNAEFRRVLYYSNPNNTVAGTPTGQTGSDNMRQINEQFDAVASHQTNTPIGFNIQIESPYLVAPNTVYCPEAVIQCGQAPYTIQWRVSQDGFNYFFIADTESFCDFAEQAGTAKYYELTVTDATGQERTAFLTVNVWDFTFFRQGNLVAQNRKATTGEIYPNPATDKINVSFVIENNDNYTIDLSDLSGRVVKQIKKDNLDQGSTQNVVLDVSDVPNGMYLLKISGAANARSEKIVINH